MSMTVEQMDDVMTATLPNLQKRKMSQMAQTMQIHEVVPKWFTQDKMVKSGGTSIQKRILNNLPDSSRMITVDETDNPNIPKILDKISLPWRMHESHYAWFLETDILMNSGEAEIVNVIKARRDAAQIKTCEFLETKAWAVPALANTLDPYGIPYWIVTDTAQTTGAQTTALPSDQTAIAGLVPANTPGWTNWAAVYTNITASDIIKKIRRAMDNTQFKSPVGRDDFYGMMGKTWRLYCGEETKLSIEDLATAQNENLGNDLAEMDGQTRIRGCALVRTVPLDSASLSPLYGINHNTFSVECLKGAIFRESPMITMPTNHRGRVVYTDTTFNFACDNRRHNFVVHLVA